MCVASASGWWCLLLCVASAACERASEGNRPPAPVPTPPVRDERWSGPRCTPDVAPRPDRDPSPMCWVPAGEVVMGLPADRAWPADFPPRKVRLSRGFYMDQYEVTVEQFVKFANEEGNRCPGPGPTDHERCLPLSVPVTFDERRDGTLVTTPGLERVPAAVYRRGALAYCAWAGKVLPTEAQWALAAFHDPATGRDHPYPWGDDARTDVTNCRDDICRDGHQHATPVGTFADDRSATGIVEMGGNVQEWVRDCFSARPSCPEPCVDPEVTTGCAQADCPAYSSCVTARGSDFAAGVEDVEHRQATALTSQRGFRCAVVMGGRRP